MRPGMRYQMEGSLLLPLGEGLLLEHVSQEAQYFLVSVRSTAPTARCPLCASASASIHSQYWRSVTDLPCSGFSVKLHLTVRRFFCRNVRCARRIVLCRNSWWAAPLYASNMRFHLPRRTFHGMLDPSLRSSYSVSLDSTASLFSRTDHILAGLTHFLAVVHP